jgi:hypothetical protein
MQDLSKLSIVELEGKKRSLQLIQMGISGIGTIGGWVYANKTGGGFWRYVGFGLLGGIAAGSVGYFTTMQRINKIDTLLEGKIKSDAKAEDTERKQ